MASLADEINCILLSRGDVGEELKGRHYRQMYDTGYVTFVSYNSDKKQVRLCSTECDGDTRLLNLQIEEAGRYDWIDKPRILPRTQSHFPRNPNCAVDIGD